MQDLTIVGIPPEPPEAKSGLEIFLEKIQDIANDPENKRKFLQVARLLLKFWKIAVKFELGIRLNDKQRELNDGLTSAADDLFNPK